MASRPAPDRIAVAAELHGGRVGLPALPVGLEPRRAAQAARRPHRPRARSDLQGDPVDARDGEAVSLRAGLDRLLPRQRGGALCLPAPSGGRLARPGGDPPGAVHGHGAGGDPVAGQPCLHRRDGHRDRSPPRARARGPARRRGRLRPAGSRPGLLGARPLLRRRGGRVDGPRAPAVVAGVRGRRPGAPLRGLVCRLGPHGREPSLASQCRPQPRLRGRGTRLERLVAARRADTREGRRSLAGTARTRGIRGAARALTHAPAGHVLERARGPSLLLAADRGQLRTGPRAGPVQIPVRGRRPASARPGKRRRRDSATGAGGLGSSRRGMPGGDRESRGASPRLRLLAKPRDRRASGAGGSRGRRFEGRPQPGPRSGQHTEHRSLVADRGPVSVRGGQVRLPG